MTCCVYNKEAALRVVEVLRAPVEARLEALRSDKDLCFKFQRLDMLSSPHLQEHVILKFADSKVCQDDFLHDDNHEIMKHYVLHLFKGVTVPKPSLPSCKEHRVGI